MSRLHKLVPFCVFSLLACTAGCFSSSVFYQHTDGENDLVGVRLPVDSNLQLDILHHINGTTMTVKDVSIVKHNYSVSNSNNYFGCIHISENRTGNITVYPTNTAFGVTSTQESTTNLK